MTYEEWIEENYPSPFSALSRCSEATELMCAAFPELRRVNGHVYTGGGGRRAHWWCVAPGGKIVDPTAQQFRDGIAVYDEADEDTLVAVGRCLNCGKRQLVPLRDAPRAASKNFCDDACAREAGIAIMAKT